MELQDKDGHIQIKYYEDIKKEGVWLTRGDSDVNEILHTSKSRVYFSRAENSGVERHIYGIGLNGEGEESLITKTIDPNGVLQIQGERLDFGFSNGGYFEAAFSPAGTYFTLSYKGPGVPWKIVKETVSNNVVAVTKSCMSLRRRILEFDYPTTKYLTIKNDHGDEMNAKMIFPPRFHDTGKYPVLIKVYGGPGTQEATKVFSIEFMHKLAIHGVIGIMVDGRGTGFKGRAYMLSVLKNLGKFESEDQISAGKWLANQPYIDKKRIALFGWSYGGYVTAKVIEADSGVFSFGIAVAPVTDWNYYDTFYTERYMKTPQQNPAGYQTSAVTNMTGFENSNFLLIHGLSDSNEKLN